MKRLQHSNFLLEIFFENAVPVFGRRILASRSIVEYGFLDNNQRLHGKGERLFQQGLVEKGEFKNGVFIDEKKI